MMLAVRSPLRQPSSANALISAFSPFSDKADSPRPAFMASPVTAMINSSDKAAHLAPPSPNNPDSIIDPSPVASSTGTDFTDVDEIPENNHTEPARPQNTFQIKSPAPGELKLETAKQVGTPYPSISDDDEPPQSVIHAPAGFGRFSDLPQRPQTAPIRDSATSRLEGHQRTESGNSQASTGRDPQASQRRPVPDQRADSNSSQNSAITITTPLITEHTAPDKRSGDTPISPPALTTALTPAKDWSERATPRAQTRQEVEDFERRPPSRSQLADIPEGQDAETGDYEEAINRAVSQFRDTEEEITALRTALAECWTLCNTLANLSHIHRERIFNFAGKGDMQEQAWKTCWRLCQNLYDNREDATPGHIRPTLDLCRDFCQALFEVRVRDNEAADSVLRVSFELNNHLYNTHDRSLPEAFRERTLDFYITLCHRLMKQNSRLAEETDSLLRACWSLAEMLFSLRQNKREGRRPDEELLGSAVQACWELCDLFREGWTQIRPDRGTPRPSQTTFTQAFNQAKRSGFVSTEETAAQRTFPETPTTIFEDTVNVSPDEAPVPNILVFGQGTPQNQTSQQRSSDAKSNTTTVKTPLSATAAQVQLASAQAAAQKWSSASSTLSTSSRHSNRSAHSAISATSSTHTVTTPSEDPNLTLLKVLFVKAALNTGFDRNSPTHNLPVFVKQLPDNSFGTQAWQVALLDNYKKVVAGDPAFRNIGPPVRAAAVDVAKAVKAMVQSGYFTWLRDLYRLVFGFYIEEASSKKAVSVQT